MDTDDTAALYIIGNQIPPEGSPGNFLSDEGYRVTESYGEEAINAVLKSSSEISLIILCLKDSSSDELNLLKTVIERFPAVPSVAFSSSTDMDLAISVMKMGAADYIPSNLNKKDIFIRIHTVLSHAYPLNQIRVLKKSLRRNKIFGSIIGDSEAIQKVFATTELIMERDVNVLILGESGTGKELLAKAIHDGSPRSKGPFVTVNCAAISVDLAESLLFGHIRGSFTGAVSDHKGYFEQANGGTIFLDEIGDMNPLVQATVLRAIEDRKIRKVGANEEQSIHVRIVSATNRNLNKFIEEGRFREDLYFRLDEYPIHIPPLRDRKNDIPLLANEFLREFCEFYEINQMNISDNALNQLSQHNWPGNIRELKNIIRRAAVQSDDVVIDTIPFPESDNNETRGSEPAEGSITDTEPTLTDTSDNEIMTQPLQRSITPLEELINNEIKKALHETHGNIEEAALLLGISRATLYRRIKKYTITEPFSI